MQVAGYSILRQGAHHLAAHARVQVCAGPPPAQPQRTAAGGNPVLKPVLDPVSDSGQLVKCLGERSLAWKGAGGQPGMSCQQRQRGGVPPHMAPAPTPPLAPGLIWPGAIPYPRCVKQAPTRSAPAASQPTASQNPLATPPHCCCRLQLPAQPLTSPSSLSLVNPQREQLHTPTAAHPTSQPLTSDSSTFKGRAERPEIGVHTLYCRPQNARSPSPFHVLQLALYISEPRALAAVRFTPLLSEVWPLTPFPYQLPALLAPGQWLIVPGTACCIAWHVVNFSRQTCTCGQRQRHGRWRRPAAVHAMVGASPLGSTAFQCWLGFGRAEAQACIVTCMATRCTYAVALAAVG